MNNIVDMGIICVSGKGYIIEKHKTVRLDQKQFYGSLLPYIKAKISYVEEMYNNIVAEGVRNDSKIEDFREM